MKRLTLTRQNKSVWQKITDTPKRVSYVSIIIFVGVGILGVYFITSSRAATISLGEEAESGIIAGNAITSSDGSASGGSKVTFGRTASTTYDAAVLSDNPVAFWDMKSTTSTEPDLTSNGHSGTYHGGTPPLITMLNGDKAVDFNGSNQYLTIPSSSSFSIATTHQFTWEAWIRPDILQYTNESSDGYVDWMGKCQNYAPTCEWESRMYSTTNPQNRCNRLSAYVFNTSAGLGSGADWQPSCGLFQANNWLHVVGEYQTLSQPSGCNGPQIGGINIWVNGIEWNQSNHLQTGCMSQYGISPTASSSPVNIGTMAFDTWFQGAVGKVAFYNYLLSQTQIDEHYFAMTGAQPSGSCANTCSIATPTP